MKRIILFLIFILAFQLISEAQFPPCKPDDCCLTYSIQTQMPFISDSSGMPYDIRESYKYLYSKAHSYNRRNWREFWAEQTYNDSIKYFMKILYAIGDFDPIMHMKFLRIIVDEFKTLPDDLEYFFVERLMTVSPERFLHTALISSDYILHVYVTDTTRMMTNSDMYPIGTVVDCLVKDTIKGKAIPDFISKNGEADKLNFNDSFCHIKFEYRPEWHPQQCSDMISTAINPFTGTIMTHRLIDTNDVSWVKKGKEYIVFLNPFFICHDSLTTYFTILPNLCESYHYGMYEIIDGKVRDPGNEFGLGVRVPVEEFKKYLRKRIKEITDFKLN